MFGDEIWDEERWEDFFRENDRRLSRYMDLLFHFISENPPPERADPAVRGAWEEDLRRFMTARGFPHDDALPGFLSDASPEGGDEEPPGDAAEEALAELAAPDPLDDLGRIPVYGLGYELAVAVLDWANGVPGDDKDSLFVQFCSNITQIPAHVARGHGLGYERDTLGGNIACVKRGLTAANTALDLLRELHETGRLDSASYARLSERTYELRNELGLYVQELRRRFDLGID